LNGEVEGESLDRCSLTAKVGAPDATPGGSNALES
jgi:hypothetical protein